ncbi:MAG: hypothetical protein ACYC6R_16230 [Anaerolineales bacterium]
MIIRIPYGTRPGEKIVEEGFFACPICHYKRPYAKLKVVKISYFGFISLPSKKALLEYLQCGGCLNMLAVEALASENQLKVELLANPLPPASLFDEWQLAYDNLRCKDLLENNPELKAINSPLIKTSAAEMQKAGVAVKLRQYNDAKVNLYNVLSLSNQWAKYNFENNNQFAKSNPAADSKHKTFSAAAHYLLSKLP